MAALLLALTTRCWDLSPEVWGPANHPIYSRWHLPKSRLLSGRIAIGGHAGGKRKLLSLAARFSAESSFAQTDSPKFFQLRRALAQRFASELRTRNPGRAWSAP